MVSLGMDTLLHRLLKKVQLRGGARRQHARRTLCTLSVRPRAPTKQMGPYRRPSRRESRITAPRRRAWMALRRSPAGGGAGVADPDRLGIHVSSRNLGGDALRG